MNVMLKALVGLLTGALTAVVLAALDHILAAAVVAVATVAVVITLLVFARHGLRRLAAAARGDLPPGARSRASSARARRVR